MFQILAAPLTHQGYKRPNNEDWTAQFEPLDIQERKESGCLYIVADGVGGASQGERASQHACQKVLYEYYQHPELSPAERLRRVVRQAGNEIYNYAEEQGSGRMATTLVAAVILEDKLIVANVGDSRAYLMRDGAVHQITRDHSLVGEMLRNGTITEEEALHSKQKNSLTRSLGGEHNTQVDIFEVDLQPGDRILLTTDGLLRYTSRQEIAELLVSGTPREAAERMVNFALSHGGADNITVLPIEIGGPLDEAALLAAATESAGTQDSGSLPKPSNWDEMDTVTPSFIPPAVPPRAGGSKGSQKRRFFRQQYYILYALFGGALLLTIIIIAVFLAMRGGSKQPASPATGNLTAIVLTATSEPATATSIPAFTPTPETLPVVAFTPNAEPTTSPNTITVCIEEVQRDETLGIILKHHGLEYECDNAETCTKYYYRESCTALDKKYTCTERLKITYSYIDPNNGTEREDFWLYPVINPGWWIEIPLEDIEDCDAEKGGKILVYENIAIQ